VYNGVVGGTAIYVEGNSRMVANKVQAPTNGTGATGCVMGRGSNLAYLGNEFTNCGVDSSDTLYHVLYIAGQRGQATPVGESNREVGWNYFHDNLGLRAINIYNGEPGGSDWISGHRIHDNVIVNQNGTGIGLLAGTVGENWIYNNLCINCGQSPTAGTEALGIYLRMGDPGGVTSSLPFLVHVFNNTLLNSGDAAGATSFKAAIGFDAYGPGTYDVRNNLVYQANGLPYVASGSRSTPTSGDGQSSNNLWYGAGAAPSFDASSINANPQLVFAVSPYDLHLQRTSPAIRAGATQTSGSAGLTDLDGFARPAGGAWDIGAYQFTAAAGSRENR